MTVRIVAAGVAVENYNLQDHAHLHFEGLDENTPPQEQTQKISGNKTQLINGYCNMINSNLGKNAFFAGRACALLLEADDTLKANAEVRAQLYYAVLEDLVNNIKVENDLSNKASALYMKANGSGVWSNHPVVLEQAQQLLTGSGITF